MSAAAAAIPMRVLIAYFSRTGHTQRLAAALADALRMRGHAVDVERIVPIEAPVRWKLVPPLLSTAPVLPLLLSVARFRRAWLRRYAQPEQTIAALAFPDVSGYDRVLVGGPKWLYLSYPVARWLRQVDGLSGRTVAAFATFCGPPLRVFELELLFSPLADRLAARGARCVSTLAVSSGYHEFFFGRELVWLFRLVSRLAFRRPLASFALDSEWGRAELARFCDDVERAPAGGEDAGARPGALSGA